MSRRKASICGSSRGMNNRLPYAHLVPEGASARRGCGLDDGWGEAVVSARLWYAIVPQADAWHASDAPDLKVGPTVVSNRLHRRPDLQVGRGGVTVRCPFR